MANNCLKTQLKVVVDNPNLEVLGTITVSRFGNTSQTTTAFKASERINLEVLEGSPLDGNATSCFIGPSGTINSLGEGTGFKPNYTESFKLRINDKYKLTEIENNFIKIDLDDLRYTNITKIDSQFITNIYYSKGENGYISASELYNILPSLTYLSITAYKGTVNELLTYYKNQMTTLNLANCAVSGGFARLGLFPNVTNYSGSTMGSQNYISGSIEDFVSNKRFSGITEGSVTFFNIGGGVVNAITFQGTRIPGSGRNQTLSWTANTITWDGGTPVSHSDNTEKQ